LTQLLRCRSGRSRLEQVAPFPEKLFEATHVELFEPDRKHVARRLRDECAVVAFLSLGLKKPSELQDVTLQRGQCVRGWALRPQRLDQLVRRDGLSGAQQQRCECRFLLRGREWEQRSVGPHFERAEDREG